VIGFSLVSGKQAKYLVPLLPAFALLAGYALSRVKAAPRWWELLPPMIGFLALPAFLAYLRARPAGMKLPVWVAEIPLWPIALAALAVPALVFFLRKDTVTQMRALAFGMLAAFAIVGAGVVPAFVPTATRGPRPGTWPRCRRGNCPWRNLGKYHAQYNFVGRLRAPDRDPRSAGGKGLGRGACRGAGDHDRAQPPRRGRCGPGVPGAVPGCLGPGVARRRAARSEARAALDSRSRHFT